MTLIRTKTRLYRTDWGTRPVKVWKLFGFVIWRRSV